MYLLIVIDCSLLCTYNYMQATPLRYRIIAVNLLKTRYHIVIFDLSALHFNLALLFFFLQFKFIL